MASARTLSRWRWTEDVRNTRHKTSGREACRWAGQTGDPMLGSRRVACCVTGQLGAAGRSLRDRHEPAANAFASKVHVHDRGCRFCIEGSVRDNGCDLTQNLSKTEAQCGAVSVRLVSALMVPRKTSVQWLWVLRASIGFASVLLSRSTLSIPSRLIRGGVSWCEERVQSSDPPAVSVRL
jgi:hypothetical protein